MQQQNADVTLFNINSKLYIQKVLLNELHIIMTLTPKQ